MTDKKNSADRVRPDPEPWTHDRPRPEWAPYDLPNVAIDMIEGEQWLENIGIRKIITGLGSSSPTDFKNGLAKLRILFETQFTEGYRQGRHASVGALLLYLSLGAASASALWLLAWIILR